MATWHNSKRISKILLVNPAISIYPEYDDLRIAQSFGLSCISGAVKTLTNCEVQFLDVAAEGAKNRKYIDKGLLRVGLSDAEIASKINSAKPDLVAISNLHTAQFPNAVEICKITKQIDPDIITVLGGTHASLNYASALYSGYVDYVVLGEGEIRLCNLIEYLRGHYDFGLLDGIATLQDSHLLLVPKQNKMSNINILPDPDFSLFEKELYGSDIFYAGLIRGKYAIPYVSSRGCPQQCRFCCSNEMWGPRFRSYDLETIQRHLEIIKNLGYDEVLFEDDNLLVNPRLAKSIFRTLKDKGFIWSLTGGLDRSRLTNEMVDLLIESRCARVNIGIESENLSLLRQYHKYRGIPDEYLEVCQHVRKLTEGGVETFGDFMIGFPEQTLDDIRKTVDFAKRLKDNGLGLALFHIVTPFPGTRFYRECKQKGYLTEPIKYENFTFAKGNLSTPNFSADQMTDLRIKFFIEVNGQEMWEESRKTLQRPNLLKYYEHHPEFKWSKFFIREGAKSYETYK
jgi:magnesium-protoporphyrin IX monomethyl ester (oxidative) cyclase